MTDNPTGPDLGALAALERAATPAPWAYEHEGGHIVHGPDGTVAEADYAPDAALIAAARNALPVLLDRLAQYEGAITWGTSCLSCANVLDGAHGETVRAEQAEKERDEARADAEQVHAVVEAAQAAVANLLDLHPNIRDAKPGWFHESTLRLVAAVDALATPAAALKADEPELCSDKNGFHDGHDWTPDPCEPYRWCPGYPVPKPTATAGSGDTQS